jgi:hypothetical protein
MKTNKRIVRLDLYKLHNEAWFQFFTEFKDLVTRFNPEVLDVNELFIMFMVLYGKADIALEVIRKSSETAQMEEADRKRDHTFRGFIDATKSGLNHFDPIKQQAATKLLVLVDHYGNIADKSLNEETATIHNFLQELTGAYAPQIAALGLADWVTELETKNNEFEDLVKQRNTEVSERTKFRMVEVRKETQDVYREIIDRIEALILINGDNAYSAFIDELNTYIKKY